MFAPKGPCIFEGCDDIARVKGYCQGHYSQYQRKGLGGLVPKRTMSLVRNPECTVSHCDRDAVSATGRALCVAHYNARQQRGKNPEDMRLPPREFTPCAYPECNRSKKILGLCGPHYDGIRRGTHPQLPGLQLVPLPGCTFDNCERVATSSRSGLCHQHKRQHREGKELTPITKRPRRTFTGLNPQRCPIEGCDRPIMFSILCENHYKLSRKYGLTPEEMTEIYGGGICQNPNCDRMVDLVVDHNHESRKVRGILCRQCNSALGFSEDSIEKLEGLIEYLRKAESR